MPRRTGQTSIQLPNWVYRLLERSAAQSERTPDNVAAWAILREIWRDEMPTTENQLRATLDDLMHKDDDD
jgi:hypothetical protein